MTSTETTPHRAVVVLSRALDQAGDVLEASTPTTSPGRRRARMGRRPPRRTPPRRPREHARDGSRRGGRLVDRAAPFESAVGPGVPQSRRRPDPPLAPGRGRQGRAPPTSTPRSSPRTPGTSSAPSGYDGELDSEVAERGLAFVSGAMTADNRGDAFGPEVEPPAGAGPYERLAAFLGREVG